MTKFQNVLILLISSATCAFYIVSGKPSRRQIIYSLWLYYFTSYKFLSVSR